jgi:hypothetical protein
MRHVGETSPFIRTQVIDTGMTLCLLQLNIGRLGSPFYTKHSDSRETTSPWCLYVLQNLQDPTQLEKKSKI